MRMAALVAVPFLLVTSLPPQGPTDPSVSKISNDLVAAFNAKDSARVGSFYADSATLMPPNAPALRGRQSIEAFFKAGMDGGITNFRLTAIESAAEGSQAFEAGTYSMRITASGGATAPGVAKGALTDTGKYVMILRRTEGTWRIVYDIFNSDFPPAGAAK